MELPIRFVVLSHARSGTHMLSTALSRHSRVKKLNEIFNFTCCPPPAPADNDDRIDEISKRLREIGWFDSPDPVGFILHFYQDRDWKVLDYLRLHRCKYVCMSRENQFARTVSMDLADIHNKWQCWKESAIPEINTIKLDPNKYVEAKEQAAKDWRWFDLAYDPSEYAHFTYDGVRENVAGNMMRACSFLGLDYEPQMSPATVKTTIKPLSEIVENYNELWDQFGGEILDQTMINGNKTPAIKLLPHPIVGEGQHHSGWPYAINALRPYCAENGILLDDYVDRSFGYYQKHTPHLEPWMGMVHHPTDAGNWVREVHTLKNIVGTPKWRASLPYLKGLICLSEFSKQQVQEYVDVPVFVTHHPIKPPTELFNWDRFIANQQKRILQLGYYCRNTLAVVQLPNIEGFIKTRVWNKSIRWINARDRALQKSFSGVRPYLGHTEHWDRLDDLTYEQVLTENVVFQEMFTASANNVVVECIVRNTPIVVNRHPALVEYLGSDYPLFYDDFSQAGGLFTLDKLHAAHQYLCTMNKETTTVHRFASDILDAVRVVGTPS